VHNGIHLRLNVHRLDPGRTSTETPYVSLYCILSSKRPLRIRSTLSVAERHPRHFARVFVSSPVSQNRTRTYKHGFNHYIVLLKLQKSCCYLSLPKKIISLMFPSECGQIVCEAKMQRQCALSALELFTDCV
jgi:hypothetical protein